MGIAPPLDERAWKGFVAEEGRSLCSPSGGCTRDLIHHPTGMAQARPLAVLPAIYAEVGTRLHCWLNPLWLVHWNRSNPCAVPPPVTSSTRPLLRFTI